jgi:hypothetical protein
MTSNSPSYSAWRRLRDAGPATLLVHAVLTVFAYYVAEPYAYLLRIPAISFDPGASPANANMFSSSLLESIRLGWPHLENQTYFWLAIPALYLLVTPLLSLLWLSSLSRPGSLLPALVKSASRYHAGLLLFALYGTTLLFTVVLFAGLPWLTHVTLSFTHNERIQDLAALAACTPGVLLFLFLSMLHDGALSALTAGEVTVWTALRIGLGSVYRLDRAMAFVGWRAAAFLLTAAGFLIAFPFPASFSHGPIPLLILSQCIAFGRTLLRGRWLASLFT